MLLTMMTTALLMKWMARVRTMVTMRQGDKGGAHDEDDDGENDNDGKTTNSNRSIVAIVIVSRAKTKEC